MDAKGTQTMQPSSKHNMPNPLCPLEAAKSSSNGDAPLSSSTAAVHSKLMTSRFADNHSPAAKPTLAPPSDGEIPTYTRDKHAYETLALSSAMFSRHLQSEKKLVDVKTIMTVMKHHVGGLAEKNREVVEWLLGKGFTVIVESFLETAKAFDAKAMLQSNPEWKSRLKFWSPDTCHGSAEKIDLVITLGGDGTVLFSSFMFQHIVPPVVSFALGSFGFLTRLDFTHFRCTLDNLFTEGIRVCLRTRLSVKFMRCIDTGIPFEERSLEEELVGKQKHEKTHEDGEEYVVLNEVVVDRGPGLTVSNTELFTLEEYITCVVADGVMVSTPTGSTAYNLAAGGPLCHPDMSAIVVTPICPHSLTFRPIVLPDSMVLRLGVPYNAIQPNSVKLDSRKQVDLKQGDYIQISVSRFPFAAVQTDAGCDAEWFDSISRGFSWGFRRPSSTDNS